MKQKSIFILVFFWSLSAPYARTITGQVLTNSNEPLVNATIVLGNEKLKTNESGNFTHSFENAVENMIVYKSSFQFKTVLITQNTNNYVVVLDSAEYSKEFAPPLRVLGGMIYNANDEPVLLQGVSIHEAYNLREDDFINWSQNWKINVVRLVMHNHDRKEEQWPKYLDQVDSVMSWSQKYKIYVLVDGYHESGSSGSVVSHWDRVQKVWDILMPRLKNYEHVIWQIYNEPNGEGGNNWEAWAPYAKILVDKIRSYSPVVNAIAVPAAVWATDLDLSKAPFDREEIIFSFHPYFGRPSPHKPVMWDKAFGYLQKQDIAPVFCSEWAAHNGGGDTANQLNLYYRPIMRYFQDNDIHFSHWGYFPSWGGMPNLVSSRIGEPEERTLWGDLLYDYFNGNEWDSLMALPTIPAKIEAEDFSNFDGLRTENTSDEGGGKNLSYVSNDSWSEYELEAKYSTKYTFAIRASSGGSGGTVTLYIDDHKQTSIDITPTGGWQTWETFLAGEDVFIDSGSRTIRLEYSSNGSSLFNVNWFSLSAEAPVELRHTKPLNSEFQIVKTDKRLQIYIANVSNKKFLHLYHLNGKLAYSMKISGNMVEIPIVNMPQGAYIILSENQSALWHHNVWNP
jgi:hypothetical protein